jgi:uncharacterized protein YceK
MHSGPFFAIERGALDPPRALGATKSARDHVLKMMKIQYFFVLAIASLVLSGCASETASTTSPPSDQTVKRVHTQKELSKTGETETGPALEKLRVALI